MPELPEVETVRMGLAPVLDGRVITRVLARRKDLRIPFPHRFAQRLKGRRVIRLWRRAKYLVADLDDGDSFVIHLGMSGRMRLENAGASSERGKHDHVVIETDAPARIVFTDHRRFGLMTIVSTSRLEAHPLFAGLGVEPLSDHFDGEVLYQMLAAKKAPIKSVLLDQRAIAGLGNIYVCEALHRARVLPKRRAGSVLRKRTDLLARSIREVLAEALKAGGSSLRDHKRVGGELGEFQHRFAVYDREGKPCPNGCGGKVRRIVQSGRSTFYCPRCQR
jgi:formamidopyrimidine-DNA glycosylase